MLIRTQLKCFSAIVMSPSDHQRGQDSTETSLSLLNRVLQSSIEDQISVKLYLLVAL